MNRTDGSNDTQTVLRTTPNPKAASDDGRHRTGLGSLSYDETKEQLAIRTCVCRLSQANGRNQHLILVEAAQSSSHRSFKGEPVAPDIVDAGIVLTWTSLLSCPIAVPVDWLLEQIHNITQHEPNCCVSTLPTV